AGCVSTVMLLPFRSFLAQEVMRYATMNTDELQRDPNGCVTRYVRGFVRTSQQNQLAELDGGPIFDSPLIGFADADDPLFAAYKDIVGPFYLSPDEFLSETSSSGAVTTGDCKAASVICWVLPVAGRTRRSNAASTTTPNALWAHTRFYGEAFNDEVRKSLVSFLTAHGYGAVAPVLSPLWHRYMDEPGGPTSNWSERHACYVAGLGTFGLSDGFITERGQAMRCGSVVTSLKLSPGNRIYSSHTENCPFYVDRSCGACITRCPADAISENGHDKEKCRDYQDHHLGYLREEYQVTITGCGLCQVGVPCEDRIPGSAVSDGDPRLVEGG
ncbi:MAG: hypothetical protein ACOC6A_06960, partial [Chloroflexota bacterium]